MKTWELKIKVSVADSWVADGFNMSERLEDLAEAIQGMLPYSYGDEVQVKSTILKAPEKTKLLALQDGTTEPRD